MGALITPGSPLPDFRLPDLTGRDYTFSDFTAAVLILNFWSAECPWVQRCDEALLPRLAGWQGQVHPHPSKAHPPTAAPWCAPAAWIEPLA